MTQPASPLQDVYQAADLTRWPQATAGVTPPVRLAVFGDPVAHSLSPQFQQAALDHYGIAARYARIHVPVAGLGTALRQLPAAGFIGVNLTIPHKMAALELVDGADEHARLLGAVNTVTVDGERLLGFNTDGPGFVRAVRAEFSVDVRDLRILILGAGGGAGRGIAVQCAREGCARLVLVNRTAAKATALAADLEPFFHSQRLLGPSARLAAIPWEEPQLRRELAQTDLVVNASAVGLQPTDPSPLPAALLAPHLLVLDTIYVAPRTRLMQAADEVGARSANGLSMLLQQGALAFEIWFGRPAPLPAMRAALERAGAVGIN